MLVNSSFVFILCFFNYTATTEIYTYLHTLSLHDALPISAISRSVVVLPQPEGPSRQTSWPFSTDRSEEHTSELQYLMRISYAVFCLKKKKKKKRKAQRAKRQSHRQPMRVNTKDKSRYKTYEYT